MTTAVLVWQTSKSDSTNTAPSSIVAKEITTEQEVAKILEKLGTPPKQAPTSPVR